MKKYFGKYLGPTLIDEAQPLTVWRTWRLGERGQRGGDVCLTATWKKNWRWEANGGVTVAECLAEKGSCNVTMRPDCDCGLWGAIALTNLLKHGAVALYPTGVLGRAHLWGFVHVYEYGFRASMGRPTAAWLGNSAGRSLLDRLARDYKIPVQIGLPVEVVVDPDLLSPKKVLAAASAYLAAETIQAITTAPRPAAPASSFPRARGRRYRCSGCGSPGHPRRTCPNCARKSVKV